jgi:hypothetical protein
MKLIRLTSSSENGIFDNYFTTPVDIKPKSQIALKSLSLENVTSDIVIDGANDTIEYQVSDSQGGLEATLNHKTYDHHNAAFLLDDFTNKLNINLTIDGKIDSNGAEKFTNVGREYFVTDVAVKSQSKNKIGIKLGISSVKDWGSYTQYTKATDNFERIQVGTDFTYSPNTTSEVGDCYAYSNHYLATGGGQISAKIDLLNEDESFLIGFTTTNPATCVNDNLFDLSKITFGAKVKKSEVGQKIFTTQGLNNYTESSVFVVFGDHLCLGKNKNKLGIYRYRPSNTVPDTILEIPYDQNKNYYPVVVFLGNNCRIRQFKYTPSPFGSNAETDSTPNEESDLGALSPSFNQSKSNQSITLPPLLAQYFGYEHNSFSIKDIKFEWNANYLFSANNKSDAFVVEMLNLNLESFDGLTSSRSSILDIIPQDDANGNIVYSANYPTFINIDNAFPISLRNLRCRVLNSDLSQLVMKGLATLVLIVRTNDEK